MSMTSMTTRRITFVTCATRPGPRCATSSWASNQHRSSLMSVSSIFDIFYLNHPVYIGIYYTFNSEHLSFRVSFITSINVCISLIWGLMDLCVLLDLYTLSPPEDCRAAQDCIMEVM